MRARIKSHITVPLAAFFSVALFAGCSPTVKVQAPDKPIEINMNIKIEQEVRVKIENELNAAIADDPQLFGVPLQKETPVHP